MFKRLLAASLVIAGTLGIYTTVQAAEPVKIGFSIPKTGLFAPAGPSQLNAYLVWQDLVNAKGGLDIGGKGRRKVEFIHYDDKSDPAQAVKIYEKLITSDKVDLIMAPWGTQHHFAIAPVVERHKFPLIGNTAASVALRKVKPGYLWFTTPMMPDNLAKEMTAMLKSRGVKSVAIMYNLLQFASENVQFLKPALAKAGIKVKFEAKYPPDIKDMTGMLTKIKIANPDAVLVHSYPGDSILYMNQAREIGITAKTQYVMVGPAIGFFRGMFKSNLDGIITMGSWTPTMKGTTGAGEFYAAYKKKFKGHEPDYLDSAEVFVSAQILEQAIAKVGLDREKIRGAINSMTFKTIYGDVKFEGVQNSTIPAGFAQIQNGKIEIVWPKQRATSSVKDKGAWAK
ncbi:MAG: amino acid ABC transporter substrate-binding protein [Rhodospirillales bacterium]